MTNRHNAAACDHRLALSQPAICYDATEDRHEISRRGVAAVNEGGFFLREKEMLGHVIDQQCAHAIVGEETPRLGQKKNCQAAWLSEPRLLARLNHAAAGRENPQTSSSQLTYPPSYFTPGLQSCRRKIGPSKSTTSQCWPRMNAGAIARLVPIMFPTMTFIPSERALWLMSNPSVKPPHLSSLILTTSKRPGSASTSSSPRILSSPAMGMEWSIPSSSASCPRAHGCSRRETRTSC